MKKNSELKRPSCPKCKKLMRLVSTGDKVRSFLCSDCNEWEVIKREGKKSGDNQ